jgi:hypothetical protein
LSGRSNYATAVFVDSSSTGARSPIEVCPAPRPSTRRATGSQQFATRLNKQVYFPDVLSRSALPRANPSSRPQKPPPGPTTREQDRDRGAGDRAGAVSRRRREPGTATTPPPEAEPHGWPTPGPKKNLLENWHKSRRNTAADGATPLFWRDGATPGKSAVCGRWRSACAIALQTSGKMLPHEISRSIAFSGKPVWIASSSSRKTPPGPPRDRAGDGGPSPQAD